MNDKKQESENIIPKIEKETLEEVLKSIMNTLDKDDFVYDKEKIDTLIKELKENNLLDSPEDANAFVFANIENFSRYFAYSIIGKDIVKVSNTELFIWQHYSNISTWLEDFIYYLEKSTSAIADKAQWLLNAYLTFEEKGTIPDFKDQKECYYKPSVGTWEQWKNIIEGYAESQLCFSPTLVVTIVLLCEEVANMRKESSIKK